MSGTNTSGDVPFVRSMLAVGAGFFTTQVLSLATMLLGGQLFPSLFDAQGRALNEDGLQALLCAAAVVNCLSGYITARIAAQSFILHAGATGFINELIAIALAAFAWEAAPAWFQLSSILVPLPMALIGGKLRERQLTHSS